MNWQRLREIEAFSDLMKQAQGQTQGHTLLVPELATLWQLNKYRVLRSYHGEPLKNRSPRDQLSHHGVTLCNPRVSLGSSWVTLESFLVNQGSCWVTLGLSWVALGSYCVILGSSWATQWSPSITQGYPRSLSVKFHKDPSSIGIDIGS